MRPEGYHFDGDALCVNCALAELNQDEIDNNPDIIPIYFNSESDYMVRCDDCGKWLGTLTSAGIVSLGITVGSQLYNLMMRALDDDMKLAICVYQDHELFQSSLLDALKIDGSLTDD